MELTLVTLRMTAFLAVALMLPQILGYAAYRWTKNKPRFEAILFLIPPAVFFVSAYLFWEYQAKAVREAGYRVCGAMGAAMAISTWFGTLLHLIFGALLLGALLFFRRRKSVQAVRPD